MSDSKDPYFALFELCLASAEKVSDRRAASNTWLLSVNSAIVGLYGTLAADKSIIIPTGQKAIWLWAIPAAGIIVSLAWSGLLDSYRKLNHAKFKVLQDLETHLTAQPFASEQTFYRAASRLPLSRVESVIPLCFLGLYIAILLAVLFRG